MDQFDLLSWQLRMMWNENKRRKKEEASPWWSLLESLPDPVAISCLASVSRLDHAALSLASKSCRSLVVSPELYQTRSVMGYTEKYVYICLSMPPDPTPRWFILRKNRAHAIPSCPSQPPEGSAVVALDWGIYVIGGLVNGKRTSRVLLLDCRSHKWHHVTSMTLARDSAQASVVNGKIYVMGGCEEDDNSSYWGEVFDPKTQTWAMLEDKVAKKSDWCCVIDNLLYTCWSDGIIYWYDQVGMCWTEVMGLPLQILQGRLSRSKLVHYGRETARAWESFMVMHNVSGNLEDILPGAKMTNFGHNILLFWDSRPVGIRHKSLQIWCAEITLKGYEIGGGIDYSIYGNVEWSDAILTVDHHDPLLSRSKLLYTISVDV